MRRLSVVEAHLDRKAVQKVSTTPQWATHIVDPVDKNTLLAERTLKGKTLFITGASRGIGLAIALRAAKDGANVVIAAKTDSENPKLPGTIFSAAKEIEAAGGKALPVRVDVRDEASIQAAIDAAVAKFGGIDILINNASALFPTTTEVTDMKKYDLMQSINARGTFLCTKLCLPHLRKGSNPHVLTISPPLDMKAKWFGKHVGYTISKCGMSMCVLGHAEEFKKYKIAVNALWPRTWIATTAVNNLFGGEPMMRQSRKPSIMGDAAQCILTRRSDLVSGNFFVDDEVLASEGLATNGFNEYRVDPTNPSLLPDFFL